MPATLARGVITPTSRYVCPLCRPHISSLAGGPKRYQHTRPTGNVGGDTDQEVISKDMRESGTSTSRTSISDIVRAFMFKPDEKDKESKGDAKYGSPESPPIVPKDKHPTMSQLKPGTDVGQRKLQKKFAAQRRKDMLAMQVSQGLKGTEETKDVSKPPRVPESIEQSPKKRSARAARLEKRQLKSHKAALAKQAKKQKASERSKQSQAKLTDLANTKVARIATSMKSQAAAQLPTDIEVSGAEDQKANNNDSAGKAPSKRWATSQKLDDVMNVLDPSKDAKKSENSAGLVKKAGEMKTRSTDIELQKVVKAVLEKLQNRGVSPDKNHGNAIAFLKSTSEDTSQSSKLQILSKRAFRKDATVKKIWSDWPLALVRKHRARPRLRRLKGSERYPEGTQSPRDALRKGQLDKAKAGHDLRSEKDQRAALKIQRLDKAKRLDTARSSVASRSGNAQKPSAPLEAPRRKTRKSKVSSIEMSTASNLELMPVMVEQPPVPRLAYGLERVLFNPGVYQLQDPRSRVYNFDPYLQKIMPVEEFDFNALKEYITSSRDESLNKIAKEHGKRYMGSTSSMTGVLAHFHYLLSQWRPVNTSMLSKTFPAGMNTFTEIQRAPSAIILRWKNDSYAIDADKEFASANVLSMLGKSMEKFLTLSMHDFERYRKSNPDQVTEDERFAPESYHYSTLGDFLMRSQLDSHDPRLPGTGMFDLKTRSVISIRMDVSHYQHGIGYEIMNPQGQWESYEREYYDMIRSAFLKYSLQVRMGRMDGIFVAFHNIERIFGFQYISLPEMDCTIHGQRDTSIGDQEFKLSLDLMNKVLDRATKKFPETSLRIFFETREASTNFMYIFAEPVTEEQVAEIQSQKDAEIQEFERNILGLKRGKDSDTNDAPEIDPKWEQIQSDVQKAMEEDELCEDRSGIDEDTEGTEPNSNRPEVFEQGPLYARKSASGASNGATAVSAGYEEDEGENKEEVEDEEDRDDRDSDGNGDFEESRRQGGPKEFLIDEADVNATDAVKTEHKVDETGTQQNNVAPSEGYPVQVQSIINVSREERNEDDTLSAISRQQGTNAELSTSAEGEGQQEYQTPTGQALPDRNNAEVVQAETAATSSGSEGLLAMTLTLRNKVNGKYVDRPETMRAADEWSVEYSLSDVSAQGKARALYDACVLRRKKKLERQQVSDEEEAVIPGFIQHLRSLSRKGRNWRKKQDEMDEERPVQMVSEEQAQGAAARDGAA